MSQAAQDSANFAYDPFSHEVMRNPLPFYRVLRDSHPVYYMPQYDAFAISRFADIHEVYKNESSLHTMEGTLTERTALSTRNRGPQVEPVRESLPLLGWNQPPDYEHIRQAMGQQLRRSFVNGLEEDIRARTRALLDALVPRGKFDVVTDFGGIIAAGSVCRLTGIPIERAAETYEAARLAGAQDPVTGGFAPDWLKNRNRLLDICRDAVRAHKDDPNLDPASAIGGLRALKVKGRELTVDEITTFVSSIVFGGAETLPKVMAHGFMELAAAPHQREAIRADLKKNSVAAMEEILRYCAPAQWFMRTVKTPVTIAGQAMEPGQRILTLLAAANRDEREFPEPDRFIWNRKIVRHLALGHGLHSCIGIHLAKLEGQVMLQEVLARIPHYTITDAVRTPSSFQWGYTSAVLHTNA
ncbi:cytochrome P450 [Ramlibacter sp.]|uniref:cytochrome P450 n=1 Tax=Ramlibacter sp. TaxID=1917967 RepID=UPI003D136C73